MDYTCYNIPTEKEINDYIREINNHVKSACSVLLQWNYAIAAQNPEQIGKNTRSVFSAIELPVVALTDTLLRYLFSSTTLESITKLYQFIHRVDYDVSLEECFDGGAIGTLFRFHYNF